jgi:hypothetical protein
MRKAIILTILFLSGSLFASNPDLEINLKNTQPQELNIDKVGKEVKAKNSKLRKLINKKVQRKLFSSAEQLILDVVKTASGVYYEKMGLDVIKAEFTDFTEDQYDVLNFFILTRVASELDRKNFLAEEDSMRLELYRDRRDKLYSSLSEIMVKIEGVSDDVIKSIK